MCFTRNMELELVLLNITVNQTGVTFSHYDVRPDDIQSHLVEDPTTS